MNIYAGDLIFDYYTLFSNCEIQIFYENNKWNLVWKRRQDIPITIHFDNDVFEVNTDSFTLSFEGINNIKPFFDSSPRASISTGKVYKLLAKTTFFKISKDKKVLLIEHLGYNLLFLSFQQMYIKK